MQVAIDVGYGFTKALASSGMGAMFPSAIALTRGTGDLATVLGGHAPTGRLRVQIGEIPASEYLFGNAALAAGATRSWSADGDGRQDYTLLVLAALAAVGAEGPVDLALGLPLSVYLSREQRKALRDRISGLAAQVSFDGGATSNVNVGSVRVLPQAVGAYYQALLGPDGASLVGRNVGVVDIGYHTTDYLLLTAEGGTAAPDETRSGSIDAGMSQVIDAVRQYVSRVSGVPFSPPEGVIETELRNGGHIAVRGRDIDLRSAYAEALQDLVNRIEAEIERAWGSKIDYLAAVLLAGGGSTAVSSRLHFPGLRTVPAPAFANAAGFLAMLSSASARSQSGVAGH